MTNFEEYISTTYREDLLDEIKDNDFIDKVYRLRELLYESKYCVIYTGAGISTNAGIPDYRGPNGVWTKRKNNDMSWMKMDDILYNNSIKPSDGHYIISNLVKCNKVKSVISTNIDGLHVVSGLDRQLNLIELHGNKYVEECRTCLKEYYRDKPITDIKSLNHYTGNKCIECNKELTNNILNFGEGYLEVPSFELQYDRAFVEMCRADLVIVIGSSLLVPSACDLVDYVVEHGGKLVIVNKQKTPKDHMAELVIHGDCDEVLGKLY